MTDETFKKEIFERINAMYKLLIPIQNLGPYGSDEEWSLWVKNCEVYCNGIENPQIKDAVARFLCDMGFCISKLNKES